MFINLIDKILFGVILCLMFQVPLLSDHYLQFLSGYYLSAREQVEGYRQNAREHNYPHAQAMINDFMRNPNAAVRRDGEQKLRMMQNYDQLVHSVNILKQGYLLEKIWFMLNPAQWSTLRRVLENYQPGIPLAPRDIFFTSLLALIFNTIIILPFRLLSRFR